MPESVDGVHAPNPSFPEVAPDFPVEVLPGRLRSLVDEISETRKVPAIIPASGCLATVAASLGRGLVARKGDRINYGNLYIAISARTGVGKGSAEPAIQPFRQFQDTERLKWRESVAGLLSPAMSGWVDALPIPAGQPRRNKRLPTFVTEDTTGAGLELILAENRGLTFSVSTEAAGLLNEISKANSQLKRLLLKGFSGEAFDSARASRKPVHLSRPCISILWLVQPHRLQELFKNRNLIADGFLGRVLVAHSKANMQELDGTTRSIKLSVQGNYDALISSLLDTYYLHADSGGSLEIPMTPECQEALTDFHNRAARKWNACQVEAEQDLLTRSSELAWKVTVVLHAADLGATAHLSPPSLQTVSNAIRLVEWFQGNAKSILLPAECLDPRLRQLLQKLQNSPDHSISVRNLKNHHHFTQVELEDLLVRFPAYIQFDSGKGGRGRPSPKIRMVASDRP